ncbi:hypothetical protein VT06_16840 [Arsukibacterium sp. MJ3]|uniref:hypothetical protein n=1 Tax=Arsukibacterium sp. MJ3 TaxID=1632859 RepID=UPI000626F81A|nr:hypothetical protein [Arsukibacterium sp. MJ3]KKO47489.1 hypothetical protein VT06_16840 [Arsukibacterium sp. MJ3]
MKKKRHVREYMFFQILGVVTVMLFFKGEFAYSLIALLIAFLFYRFDPSIKDFCENIKHTRKIFWGQIFIGYVMAGVCFIFSWNSKGLSIIWALIFLAVGVLHAGKVQDFLNERRG